MIAIGKNSWPKAKYRWPSGFFLENLQLDCLASPELEAPYKNVYIYSSAAKKLESRFLSAAERVFGEAELSKWTFIISDSGLGIWSWIQPRNELFSMLLHGDGREFVECLVTHFEQMAKFTSVIDEIVDVTAQRRK
jgi:hypothetical protein